MLPDKLKGKPIPQRKVSSGPVWEGPCGKGYNGGISQSMIARYLVCKERFRVGVMDGVRVRDQFNSRIEFGNMWHIAEEAVGSEVRHFGEYVGTTVVEDELLKYATELGNKYPLQRAEITEWHAKCVNLFPVYLKYWRDRSEKVERKPLLREQVFDVPYRLPSGRVVRLRGKWDGVDLVENGMWNVENKTKSSIDVVQISQQLTFDLQTMTYLVTLTRVPSDKMFAVIHAAGITLGLPLRGVRYNVVRRSAHKSVESMLKKVHEDIESGRGSEWFSRWDVEVMPGDIERFRKVCLDPILENLCDDYEWWEWCFNYVPKASPFDERSQRREFPNHYPRHFIMPFIGYNPITEGASTDLDDYIRTGDMTGLTRVENLFPELQT